MWFNFAHLFSVSLLPLSTAWMAVSKLATQPVAFYAAVFFFVNAACMALIWELLERSPVKEIPPKKRWIMRFRSIATLSVFGVDCGRGVQISAGRTWNVYFLPNCLSEARGHRALIVRISLTA
jgi:uncharacterized membrane protein